MIKESQRAKYWPKLHQPVNCHFRKSPNLCQWKWEQGAREVNTSIPFAWLPKKSLPILRNQASVPSEPGTASRSSPSWWSVAEQYLGSVWDYPAWYLAASCPNQEPRGKGKPSPGKAQMSISCCLAVLTAFHGHCCRPCSLLMGIWGFRDASCLPESEFHTAWQKAKNVHFWMNVAFVTMTKGLQDLTQAMFMPQRCRRCQGFQTAMLQHYIKTFCQLITTAAICLLLY